MKVSTTIYKQMTQRHLSQNATKVSRFRLSVLRKSSYCNCHKVLSMRFRKFLSFSLRNLHVNDPLTLTYKTRKTRRFYLSIRRVTFHYPNRSFGHRLDLEVHPQLRG